MTGLGILFGFFFFVMAGITVAGYFWSLRGEANTSPTSAPSPTFTGEPAMAPGRAAFVDLFRSLGENVPASQKEANPYRRRLSLAGYRWPSAVPVFYGIKMATGAFLSGLAGVACLYYRGDLSVVPVAMICGAGIGWLMPDRVLDNRVKARGVRLRQGLAPALDLLVLGLEAGQALDQTIADTSRALKNTHPDLSAELAQLYLELRASNSRAGAFKNLAERTKEPELRKLTNVLVDSDRFGVSLGPSLRSHNKYLRTRFRQKAQESARKIGVKLIFPVFFLIFPSVLLVTLGPAVIMMMNQLQNMLK